MEEESSEGGNASKLSYVLVVVFLALLVVGGAIFVGAGKDKEKTALPTQVPSATINSELNTAGATAEPSANPMDKVDHIQIEDEVVGTGADAVSGKKVTVNYVGTLTDGTKFDSSYDHGAPFSFNLGAGEVIPGWDQGVVGMKVGGKRKLTIPSSLAYGDAGIPGTIPGGATLIFEIELLDVE